METSPLARRLSHRFIAGEILDQALEVSGRINAEGIDAALDHLGESVTTLTEAAQARDICLETLDAIHRCGIRGYLSIKLTQFGIDLSEEQCRANVEQLVQCAAALNGFVRVDMESSAYTERTLRLVCDLHARYGAVGAVVQAYLHRSRADIEMLCARRIRVRLVKGAYLEPASEVFTRKSEVDHNYVKLMQHLLDNGEHPAIATHDEKILEQVKTYAAQRKIPRDSFEFQMLYGIRRDLQRRLVTEGYRLRLYIPFGQAWYPYFMRRLAERPANILFLARNLLRR